MTVITHYISSARSMTTATSMEATLCFFLSARNPSPLLFLSPTPNLPIPIHGAKARVRASVLSPAKPPALLLPRKQAAARGSVSASSETLAPETEESTVSKQLWKETEAALDWRAMCAQVAGFAATAAGRASCKEGRLPIGRDRKESERLLEQAAAATQLPRPLDFDGVDDVSVIVAAANGQVLGIRDICAVGRTLRSAKSVFEQLERVSKDSDERYSPLLNILRDCDFLTELEQNIEFSIDCNLSIVLDRASQKLESIRMQRRRNFERLEALLKETSMKVFQEGGIDKPLVTKRRSRMCVGVKTSHKALVPNGIVLSSSSSGATYFMEPRDAVELNNMEVRLSSDERSEELAILGFLTLQIADSEMKISHLMDKILELDLACARGSYALWMNGVRPTFSEENENSKPEAISNYSVYIEGIRHPLLFKSSPKTFASLDMVEGSATKIKESRKEVKDSEELPVADMPVPLDIRIRHSTRIVVISGPNTGGKTATMKTLGLASLMSKAGMFLPAKGRPRLPWFDQVLADIGDHQSLEHSLSTFSGHISRLRRMTEVLSRESLVLIDEIGSGTDPSEGVALSTSILKYLATCVNIAVVTTHYADLSRLKAVDPRFENAAMEFCLETLQPTYRILWGTTGNSNALSIAKSIGFDQEILVHAQEWVEKLLPDKQKERQGLLYDSLLEERNLLESQTKAAEFALSDVMSLYKEIHSKAEDLDRRETTLRARESRKTNQELKVVKTQMDLIIKGFETQLTNSKLDQFNSIMRKAEAAVSSLVEAHSPTEDIFNDETENQNSYVPRIGDIVHVKSLGGKLATVVEEPGEDGITMVQYGKINVRVRRNEMKLVQRSTKETTTTSYIKQKGQGQSSKRSSTEANKDEEIPFGPVVQTSKNTVDLRGMRFEEASLHLQMTISGCRSHRVLFIIHGMGTGAVKKCALDILRNHPRVVKFEEESPLNYGCTIAYIK